MNFADKLTKRISDLANPTVVGLNPILNQIPSFIKEKAIKKYGETTKSVAEAIIEFNKGVIDAIYDIVPVIKLQIAFYECYGHEGFRAYEETIRYAQEKEMIVISDADGFFGTVNGFDSLIVTPYLGTDAINPFTKICSEEVKGIFILVRTSNPSADEIQSQPVGDHLMDEHIATLVEGWGRDLIGDESGFSSVGAIVDTNYPEEAHILRNLMPHQIFLVTNYKTEDGETKDVKPYFYDNGTGAIIELSDEVIFAYEKQGKSGESYAESARDAVINMKNNLGKFFK